MRKLAARALSAALLVVGLACGAEQVGSIGVVLARDGDTGSLYVRDLGPSAMDERAGLLPGDEIVMIDGRYVRELDAGRVRALLRGEVGTAVDLTVVRGEEVRRVHVRRVPLRHAGEVRPRVETMAE